jgi:hypothetical protein
MSVQYSTKHWQKALAVIDRIWGKVAKALCTHNTYTSKKAPEEERTMPIGAVPTPTAKRAFCGLPNVGRGYLSDDVEPTPGHMVVYGYLEGCNLSGKLDLILQNI